MCSQGSQYTLLLVSDDPYLAGRDSDAFMIPNLNVAYNEVLEIIWNATTCSAERDSEIIMDVQSTANKQALSFVSVYDVETAIIPKLDGLIRKQKDELEAGEAEDEDKAHQNLLALSNAKIGWQDAVDSRDERASSDSLPTVKDWFKKWARQVRKEIDSVSLSDTYVDQQQLTSFLFFGFPLPQE